MDESIVEAFRSDGFTAVHGLFSTEETARYRRAALRALDHGRKDTTGETGIVATTDTWEKDAGLRELALHPRLGAIAERLAGIQLRVWGGEVAAKPPGETAMTGLHDDLSFALLDARISLNAWIDAGTIRSGDWRTAARALAGSLRELVRRHPGAAPLLMTRPVMPHSALRITGAHLRVMRDGGVPEECAAALLRTLMSYAIGQTLAEIRYAPPGDADDDAERVRLVDTLIPDDTPAELAHVAYAVCGACGTTRQFDIGVDLMIRGLSAYLDEPPA